MFMGDSGSMLIGLVLAGVGADADGQFPHRRVGETTQASLLPVLLPVLLPISILVLPFLDLLLAIFRRTRKGPRRSAPTSSTCTTGCSSSATPTAARW